LPWRVDQPCGPPRRNLKAAPASPLLGSFLLGYRIKRNRVSNLEPFSEQMPRRLPHVSCGSKAVLTALKWDVCSTPESRHRSAYAGICDVKEVAGRSNYNNFLYARAATWVNATMLRPDQQPLPHAVDAKNSVAALLLLE
jgi:hypothetical protein